MEINNRIIAILAYLRGCVVGMHAQRKLDKLNEKLEI